MKRPVALALLAALLTSGAALAAPIRAGAPVYVRTQNTALKKEASASAKLLKKLQPGEKLEYVRQATPRQYHEVKTQKGLTGFVWYQNISAQPPANELVIVKGAAKSVDAQAFASTGAAARGVSEGAKKVSQRVDGKTSANQFAVLEQVAGKVKTAGAAQKHARSAGLAMEGTP